MLGAWSGGGGLWCGHLVLILVEHCIEAWPWVSKKADCRIVVNSVERPSRLGLEEPAWGPSQLSARFISQKIIRVISQMIALGFVPVPGAAR